MSRQLPPLNAVRAFEAAARHVSFTKAAAELSVTHGAISRQVAILESWVGSALFRRSASQLTLTESGRSYAAEVTSLLDRLAVASGNLKIDATPTALNVSAPPTFTMRWLLPRLSTFQRLRPDVEIRLTTSLAPVSFHENSYDVAIRGAHAPLQTCLSQPFMTELIVPICHVDLQDGGRLARPADLARHTLISYGTEPCSWTEWLAAAGQARVKGAHMLNFEQMFFALQAAAEGLGVVLVPLFLVLDEIIAGRLCAPFGLGGAQKRRYYANAASASPKARIVADLCEWLVREGRDTEAATDAWAQEKGWVLGPVAASR
jgi:LysR family transcriptional regulator, glycine cleavage system transcriptional activator